jgi:ribulose-phosphate 3-epimerase
MEKETLIRPSLLSADFSALGKDVEEAIDLAIEQIHFDVMDGTFVDNISFGEPVFASLNKKYGDKMVFDVHLMVINPLKQLVQFAELGAKEVAIHFEAMMPGDYDAIAEIKSRFPGLKVGLAINPLTSIASVEPVLDEFDFVLVMSVVPGKGGQSFIEGSELKIQELAELRDSLKLTYKIGVDGGINATTAPLCYKAGADYMVAGSYYFKAKDRAAVLAEVHRELGE